MNKGAPHAGASAATTAIESSRASALATQRLLAPVQAHLQRQEWARARAALVQAVAAAAHDAKASAVVGDLCCALGEYATAHQAYDQAVHLEPGQAIRWFNRASVRRFLGRLEEAEADFDQSIVLAPEDGLAWLNRSELRVQRPDRNHVEALERHIAQGFKTWQAEVPIRYALAKEYEDLGRYAESWTQLSLGARLRRQHLQYDLATDLATVDWLIDAFPGGARRAEGHPSSEPIFILGMPRTGSTLVDRMIGSHSAVHSAGELTAFGSAVVAAAHRALGASPAKPTRRELIQASARADFQALAADYLAQAHSRTTGTPHFTDKLPLNYLYCGLIDAALPNAKIVHVTRHPMATCYGIYKVLFDQGYPFSYDLEEIAQYYIGYRRLMEHWKRTMPGRIVEIEYEALVADPEQKCQALIEVLDLSWEASCLAFHLNTAATATASAAQVRRPLYSSAVETWRHYAPHLKQIQGTLKSAGISPGASE